MKDTYKGAFVNEPPFTKNYGDSFLVFTKGKDAWLWDRLGKKYLDFGSGIAVNSFGHGRADFAKIVSKQMRTLAHTSNLFTTEATLGIARRLVASSPLAKDQPYSLDRPAQYFAGVHLGNSGSEANETALKYARIYAKRKPSPNGHKILAFQNSFHGRTMGALSTTYTEKYRLPSEPLIPGVEFIPYNDSAALEAILSTEFCAVIVEPIQGEGGLMPMDPDFAKKLNELCTKLDVVLIADEIQTGLGRTGTLFASEAIGLEPDIISLAKPLAGGLPMSATLVRTKIHETIHAGDHGGTFGGNPVASSLASYIWDTVTKEEFAGKIRNQALNFRAAIFALKKEFPWIGNERGRGMLVGYEIMNPKNPSQILKSEELAKLIELCRDEGLIVLRSGVHILRMAPPLTLKDKELKVGIELLRKACKKFEIIL